MILPFYVLQESILQYVLLLQYGVFWIINRVNIHRLSYKMHLSKIVFFSLSGINRNFLFNIIICKSSLYFCHFIDLKSSIVIVFKISSVALPLSIIWATLIDWFWRIISNMFLTVRAFAKF